MYTGTLKGETVVEKMFSVISEPLWTDKKFWEKICVTDTTRLSNLTKRGHIVGKPYNEPIAEDQVFSVWQNWLKTKHVL